MISTLIHIVCNKHRKFSGSYLQIAWYMGIFRCAEHESAYKNTRKCPKVSVSASKCPQVSLKCARLRFQCRKIKVEYETLECRPSLLYLNSTTLTRNWSMDHCAQKEDCWTYFFNRTRNAERYRLEILTHFVEMLHDDEMQEDYIQQDRARPHTTRETINYFI
ncbi:hypothetical protein NQ318_009402 [Aromia moschata]|uniref:Uncharacterized protein n=1 Tax=Aromia moschata TaxID=1265417 RepID=A0AAV8Z784_9CUCU|nr:hypothetical protein NQ318_009402 [Aromia moschata]